MLNPSSFQPHQRSLSHLARDLRAKTLSSRELTQDCLNQIQRVDPLVKAFLHLDPDQALQQADAADRQLAQNSPSNSPLLGIPIALKDNLAQIGAPMTCGSKILNHFQSPYDATVIQKLREAGAILLGRLNMDEFAMGSSTENSAFGPSRNPWDISRVPGGSSGGSAAAVAADECIASIGSDTGGSIRQPAAFCGCVGLKPTYGLVSRYGLVAFASSLDQIGPFTKTVEDSALMLQALAGHDSRDSTSVNQPVPDYSQTLHTPIKGLKLGLPKEYFIPGLDPQIKAALNQAIETYQQQGVEIQEISLPHTDYAVATYYILATAEASANLARFDGIRYGLRVPGKDPLDLYQKSRSQGFGPEVKRRIILGTYALSSGYYDAFYLRAQKVRSLIRADFENAFQSVDAILTPTTSTPAFRIGERSADPLQMYLSDIFTISCNLAGFSGISIPCGFTTDNLPIGFQLLGKPFGESQIFQLGHAYQSATSWHLCKPEILKQTA